MPGQIPWEYGCSTKRYSIAGFGTPSGLESRQGNLLSRLRGGGLAVRGIDGEWAAWQRNGDSGIIVIHRGMLGGGKKGVGKSFFADHYRGVWTMMGDGPLETPVALIGLLNSSLFVRQVTQFIRKIDMIKNSFSSRSSQLEMTFEELSFREDQIGKSHIHPIIDPGFACDHGLIIKGLHDVQFSGFQSSKRP